MYLVTIINNDIRTVINDGITEKNNNKITGTIKQGINSIDSFTFNIYKNNVGFDLIRPLKTLIEVFNLNTQEIEFRGRVLMPISEMESNGNIYKTYTCESELAYLIDSKQSHNIFTQVTVKNFLESILEGHNSRLEKYKSFKVGKVEFDNVLDIVNTYDSTLENINNNLINVIGGELQVRYENDIRYLDFLKRVGKDCDEEIKLAKNIKKISEKIIITDNYCTRLIPLGAKLNDTEERLTIKSVNNNLDYIDDVEAIEEFGIIEGHKEFDEITRASELLEKGRECLETQKLNLSNAIDVADLSLIDKEKENLKVGNSYPIIHELLDIDYRLRIIEKEIRIEDPSLNSVNFGEKEIDINSYNVNKNKNIDKTVKEATKNIINVTNKISDLNTKVENANSNINQLNLTFNEDFLTNLNQRLQDFEDRLATLEGGGTIG